MVIAAAKPEQRSWEDEKLQHGIFTYHLLEALSGKADNNEDGYVSIQEVVSYLQREVPRTVKLLGKEPQDPTMICESLTRDIVLTVDTERAKAKAQELQSDVERWFAHMESRVAVEVSPTAARDFRRGMESRPPEPENTMRLLQDYFSEIEQLTGFLIERRRRHRITGDALVFDRDKDVRAYNARIETIARLEEQLVSARQKAEELWRQMPATP